MRNTFIFLMTLLFFSCSSAAFWGDINLGSDFYYMVDSDFNSINLSTSKDDPMRSSQYIIRDVERVGFDKNYILVTSKKNDSIQYWIIDKTQKTTELGYDSSRLLLSNVSTSTDSTKFIIYKNKFDIKVYSKHYYRKKSNYE